MSPVVSANEWECNEISAFSRNAVDRETGKIDPAISMKGCINLSDKKYFFGLKYLLFIRILKNFLRRVEARRNAYCIEDLGLGPVSNGRGVLEMNCRNGKGDFRYGEADGAGDAHSGGPANLHDESERPKTPGPAVFPDAIPEISLKNRSLQRDGRARWRQKQGDDASFRRETCWRRESRSTLPSLLEFALHQRAEAIRRRP